MNNEPGKWNLNPEACLRELGRMDDDPGYRKTICGVHRILWSVLNVDYAGHLPEEAVEKVNELLELAFRMGKRMDYRLREYHANVADASEALSKSMKGEFVEEVPFPDPEMKVKAQKKGYKRPDHE